MRFFWRSLRLCHRSGFLPNPAGASVYTFAIAAFALPGIPLYRQHKLLLQI